MAQTINVLGQSFTLPDEYAYGDLLKQVDYVASGLGWTKDQAKQAIIAGAQGIDPNNFAWYGPEVVKELALRGAGVDPAPYINQQLKAQQQQQQAEIATAASPEAAERASGDGSFLGLAKELVTGPVGKFAAGAAGLYGGVTGLGNLASSFGYNAVSPGATATGASDIAALPLDQVSAMNPVGATYPEATVIGDSAIPTVTAPEYAIGANPMISGAAAPAAAGSILSSVPSWVKTGIGALAAPVAGALISGSRGNAAADAATQAANIQSGATTTQIAAQKEALAQARGDLQPFREAGASELPALRQDISSLSSLANDPNAQKSYIENNPFFKLLADDAQSRLFANQAAKGKVGSGGTAQALQNSILLLGQDLLNQDFQRRNTALGNRSNLATLGQNAAAMQGTATQNTANNISSLATGGANAEAAGVVGAANAKTNALNAGVNTALNIGSLAARAGLFDGIRL